MWPWIVKQRRKASDWEEELKSHLALEAEQLRESGMPAEEAVVGARRAFGNVTALQEKLFEHGRWVIWDGLMRDVRHALRLAWRNPSFSAIVILTLALGIGGSTAIFGLLNAVLLRPLPYQNPERLAVLWSENRAQHLREGRVSLLNLQDWRQMNHCFEDMTFYGGQTFLLGTEGAPERLREARVPANFFPLLGVRTELGRWFTADEERTGERVVVLSHKLWERLFAGSPTAIGQNLRMDGRASKVIGVMPEHFQFPFADTEVWEPVTTHPYWAGNKIRPRSSGDWYALGRLRSGVWWAQAQAEMDGLGKRLRAEHPENAGAPEIRIVPLKLQIAGPYQLSLTILFGAVFVILLIACLNVASLLLARGSVREREFAVRRTLGAGSLRLAAQLFSEMLVLSIIGAVLGLLVAAACLQAMVAFGPQEIPRLHEAHIDGAVLVYAIAMAFFTALVAGVVPALKTSAPAAKSRTWSTATDRNIRNVLVVGEFAMALILCVGAGLLMRSFLQLRSVDRGFRPEHLLTMRIDLHVGKTASQRAAYFEKAVERALSVPGVRSAGAIGRFLRSYPPQPILIEGRLADSSRQVLQAADDVISGPYFQTVGVSLKAGRLFSEADNASSPMVAVINETMARTYWPKGSALGKRFLYPDPDSKTAPPWITIVGVVGDTHREGLEKAMAPQVFRPENQTPDNEMDLVVRTAREASAVAEHVRDAVQFMDNRVAKFRVESVEAALGEEGAERRFDTSLMGLFSLVALFFAGIGIYGLIHHSVVQRKHEIGVRMALGATRGAIVRLVLGQGLALSAAGVVVGVLGAITLTKLLSSLLFAVTPTDPIAFAGATALLVSLAVVACWLPATRAARIDPATALRQD